MKRAAILLVMTLALFSCLERMEPAQSIEATLSDSGEYAPEGIQYSCESIKARWDEFIKDAIKCHKDDSCVVVGYRGNCDCSYGISGPGPNGVGISINKNKYSDSVEIEKIYFSVCKDSRRCSSDSIVDIPGKCVNGICTSRPNTEGCL
jgi:hypothetical protein